MIKWVTTTISAASLLLAGTAHADHPEIVFKGGLSVTDTAGCTPGYDPLNLYVQGFYLVPIPGSVNGPDSFLSFHANSGSASVFELSGKSFTSDYQAVNAHYVYTHSASYLPFVKITRQIPAALTTTTTTLTVVGSIKGFGFRPGCTIDFILKAVRDAS